MGYTWNWGVLFDQTGVGSQIYLQWMLAGIGWLFVIGGIAWTIAMALGTVLGIMRTLPSVGSQRLAALYVTLFRNVPLLVQLFIWYYVVPNFLPDSVKNWWYYDLTPNTSALISAAIGLGLFTAARVCEQVRTGIQSLPRGQTQAAYALGFTTRQVYRIVLLPQAFRVILPPLGSELTNCFKNASIASLVGVAELISQTKTIAEYSQSNFEIYTYATIVYVVINMVLFAFMAFLERRYRIPGLMNEKGQS
ncbi:amino acid ABC transporter permease [Snodgrassella sp. CFCC 13594]|uniref:amino acid ABC transporter permease n=1 Tax=Snodgrassella sp. CFCC 13594 TaxID=1775559 RepID=UPI00082FFCB5|nr:amino acid ABC transporter permease [Snodgrassella sp. CFCC 13594]